MAYYQGDMIASRELLIEIRAGAEILGIAQTTLCQRAVNNSKLVDRLQRGRPVTVETVEKIRSYIRDHASGKEPAALGTSHQTEAAE